MKRSGKRKPLALDLFCGGGGVSRGLRDAGFDVVGVDSNPACAPYYRAGKCGRFICADALTFPLDGFDFVWASPPCQAHTRLKSLTKKSYPDLIPQILDRLADFGGHWCVENVEGAPLDWNLLLCGSMFNLITGDGRAELRRHRIFMTTFGVRQPACYHGGAPESLTISGTGMGVGNRGKEAHMRERRQSLTITGHSYHTSGSLKRRRAISITGSTPQTNTIRNISRSTFTVADARHTMGIPWLPMRFLSQAIPPIYSHYIARACKRVLAYG
jgi:DNA (cytosine-5)-methyltransferase 1